MSGPQGLNGLLQWGIENSDPARESAPPDQQRDPSRGLDAKMLSELLGGPSDADRMRDAMSAIVAPMDHIDLDNKLVAWDNFEQLIEQIDNANNMETLGMWPPLVQQLDNPEKEMRKHAAACCSAAVQNNIKSQERMLGTGALPKLAKLATDDVDIGVRKKAITALSSFVRNYQPGMDELEKSLPDEVWKSGRTGLDAGDMDACDELIRTLRDRSAARG